MTGDTLQTAELQHAFSRIAALEAQLQQAREELVEARRLAKLADIGQDIVTAPCVTCKQHTVYFCPFCWHHRRESVYLCAEISCREEHERVGNCARYQAGSIAPPEVKP